MAHLALAQIAMIRTHLDLAPSCERQAAEESIALGDKLARGASGGPETQAAARLLRQAIECADQTTPAATRQASVAVGGAIEALIAASGIEGDDAFLAYSQEQTIVAGRAGAWRERILFQSAGFEAVNVTLPPLASLMAPGGG